jgi:NADH-quinone oxidoreductase subunit L
LAIGSLAVGLLGLPHFVTHWQPFSQWLEPVFADVVREHEATEGAGLALRLIAVYGVIVAGGIVIGWRWFARPNPQPQRIVDALGYLHQILWRKYFVDELYDRVFVRGTLGLSRLLWRLVDVGVIDGAVNALGWASQSAASFMRRRLHNGYARFYAAGLLFGAVLLIALSLKYAAGPALAH